MKPDFIMGLLTGFALGTIFAVVSGLYLGCLNAIHTVDEKEVAEIDTNTKEMMI